MRRKKLTFNFKVQYNPADIQKLITQYLNTPNQNGTAADKERNMEAAGRRIVQSTMSRQDADIIYKWKSARRMDLFSNNTDGEVLQALRDAIAAKTPREAIESLTRLQGVGIKMASAILTGMFPELYTVCDFRAAEALGMKDSDDVDFYTSYLEFCRRTAKEYGVSLRNFDRANWQWSKNKSKGQKRQQPCAA
jgi:hypothetical protein